MSNRRDPVKQEGPRSSAERLSMQRTEGAPREERQSTDRATPRFRPEARTGRHDTIPRATREPADRDSAHYANVANARSQSSRPTTLASSTTPTSRDERIGDHSETVNPILSLPVNYRAFCNLGVTAYQSCFTYCIKRPYLWDDDYEQLKDVAAEFIDRGDDDAARQVISRYMMLRGSQKYPDHDGRLKYLEGLANPQYRERFEKACIALYESLEEEDSQLPSKASTREQKPRHIQSTTTASAIPTEDTQQHLAVRTKSGPISSKVPSVPANSTRTEQLYTSSNMPTYSYAPATSLTPAMGPPSLPTTFATDLSIQTPSTNMDTRLSGLGSPKQQRRESVNATSAPRSGLRRGESQRATSGGTPTVATNASMVATIGLSENAKRQLKEGYKLHVGRDDINEVFGLGSVIAVLWHENEGNPLPNKAASSTASNKGWTTDMAELNVKIFSHVRRFVIADKRDGHSIGLPINSYNERGLSYKKLSEREAQAHTIIYASDKQPTAFAREPQFTKDPIEVKFIRSSDTLTEASRLYYAKPQSIDHNIMVKHLGHVIREQRAIVHLTYRKELLQ